MHLRSILHCKAKELTLGVLKWQTHCNQFQPNRNVIYIYIHKRYNVATPHNVFTDLHLVG